MGRRYRFGDFTLDVAAGRLMRGSAPVALQPLQIDLLHRLVAEPGALHTRDALLEALWPGVHVTGHSLTQLVSTVRTALGEASWIQTVPRRGYRFAGDVTVEEESAPVASVAPLADTFVGRSRELEDIERRLRSGERLLCLVGPGGIGKTRLAHRLAAGRP